MDRGRLCLHPVCLRGGPDWQQGAAEYATAIPFNRQSSHRSDRGRGITFIRFVAMITMSSILSVGLEIQSHHLYGLQPVRIQLAEGLALQHIDKLTKRGDVFRTP